MFQVPQLKATISTDTAYFKVKSPRGNIVSQVYYHKCGFYSASFLTKTNDDQIGPTLTKFINEFANWYLMVRKFRKEGKRSSWTLLGEPTLTTTCQGLIDPTRTQRKEGFRTQAQVLSISGKIQHTNAFVGLCIGIHRQYHERHCQLLKVRRRKNAD